jgi:hypothetical protein
MPVLRLAATLSQIRSAVTSRSNWAKLWPLAKLQPYAKNAKAHGPDQVAKMPHSRPIRQTRTPPLNPRESATPPGDMHDLALPS